MEQKQHLLKINEPASVQKAQHVAYASPSIAHSALQHLKEGEKSIEILLKLALTAINSVVIPEARQQ